MYVFKLDDLGLTLYSNIRKFCNITFQLLLKLDSYWVS